MGNRVSRNQEIRVAPILVSSNEIFPQPTVRSVTCGKSTQTSITNLRVENFIVSSSITQDTGVQTSTLNVRSRTLTTGETKTKLLPEIKLAPDRTRTITEDHQKNPRKELISNKEYRQHIDSNCNNVKSIAELVNKIEGYSESDLIRAWLIYYWITKHITNVNGRADNTADVVFRTRTGVCRGFTNLFNECCGPLNIECVDVPGYVKENSYRIGDSLQEATHVWNAVKLSGRWYLLDTAWGAGNGREKKQEEFYFLTSPDQMIYTHLPTEDKWQLLSPPITKQEFVDLPLVKSSYYRLNLKLISPKQCVIETNQPLFEVVIKAPSDVTLTTAMKIGDDNCPDYHQLCQYHYRDNTTRCYFCPTNDGTYDLAIYGKNNQEATHMDAIHMRLKVIGLLQAPSFPILYRPFTEHQCTLIEPFRRNLHLGEQVLIRIHIPNATALKVMNNNQTMSTFDYEDGILTQELIVEGDVTVSGIFDRTEQFQPICKFNVV